MSVGYKREYEDEAIARYAKMVVIFSKIFPDNENLKAYAKEVSLRFVQAAMTEIRDIKAGNILRDRIQDCMDCVRANGKRPCGKTGPCVYSTYEYNRAAIQKHFGDRGLQMLDYMDKWITKKAAEMGVQNGNQENDRADG